MMTQMSQQGRSSLIECILYRDVPIHRYRHRLISVSFSHIGNGIDQNAVLGTSFPTPGAPFLPKMSYFQSRGHNFD